MLWSEAVWIVPQYCVTVPRSSAYSAFCRVLRRRCALFEGTHPSRGIRRCALSAGIRSRHAGVAAAHAHRMPCRVPGLPQNRAHRLRFTRAPISAPSARRSGGGDAVSRDAKCAEEASLRRVAAQIAKQSSARAKRSGRKEPRMRRGISARDGALDGAPNERRMKGGIPETAPRHSDEWAIFFRNVRGTRYSDAVLKIRWYYCNGTGIAVK